MRFLRASLLLLAVVGRAVFADEPAPAPSDEVASKDADKSTTFNGQKVPAFRELAGEDLDKALENGYTAVKFYSPQCGHCKVIAPLWQTLYEYYWTSKPVPSTASGDEANLNDFHHYYHFDFINVNCLAFGDTCTKYDVKAWPTFMIFKDGAVVDKMEGGGTIQQISAFLEKTLETIRPGSRVQGGPPDLPAVGATSARGYDEEAAKKEATKSDKKQKSEQKGVSKSKGKPNKVTSAPNPAGTSVPLTAESFQDLVTMTQEPWFIKFYAPWCHHCQAMRPVWDQLAKEMRTRLHVGEVNCEIETRLCKDVRVKAYPTMLFFRGGERVEYTGLRGVGDFLHYAESAIELGQGVQDIDAAGFKELEEKEEVIFVYFYDHATTSEDFQALDRLTLSLIGHAKIVKTNSAKLAERFKITTWPRLLVSRDGRPTYYTALAPQDMRDFRQVLKWMQSVWLPTVPELTASNSREIMHGKIVVLGILTRDRPDEFLMAKKEIKSAANEYMDKQIQQFQRDRQELRDYKQLRIEEAKDRNDQRALMRAQNIRINMDKSDRKEVAFAWVDGVFWERWIRTTYGIDIKDGEKVIINDEDNKRYWDTTITGNPIIPSRTSILETVSKVVDNPHRIKAKRTVSSFYQVYFDIKATALEHPILAIALIVVLALGGLAYGRRRRRSRGGFFKLDEPKDGLLGGNFNGKAD